MLGSVETLRYHILWECKNQHATRGEGDISEREKACEKACNQCHGKYEGKYSIRQNPNSKVNTKPQRLEKRLRPPRTTEHISTSRVKISYE